MHLLGVVNDEVGQYEMHCEMIEICLLSNYFIPFFYLFSLNTSAYISPLWEMLYVI